MGCDAKPGDCDVLRFQSLPTETTATTTQQGAPHWQRRITQRSRQRLGSDADRELHQAGGMDEKAIGRAALITLRRAICVRFPPGRERRAWLRCGWSENDGADPGREDGRSQL